MIPATVLVTSVPPVEVGALGTIIPVVVVEVIQEVHLFQLTLVKVVTVRKEKKRKHQHSAGASSEQSPYGPQLRANTAGVQGAGASGGVQSSGGAGSN